MTNTVADLLPYIPFDGEWRWKIAQSGVGHLLRVKLQRKRWGLWITREWGVIGKDEIHKPYFGLSWVCERVLDKFRSACPDAIGVYPNKENK